MEPKNELPPANYTPAEQAELEKSRTISDAELLDRGAEYAVNDKGEKVNLLTTGKQKQSIKNTHEWEQSHLEKQVEPDLDWGAIPPEKFEARELEDFVGRKLDEVRKYVIYTYGATHYIPGIKYCKYIVKNPDKAPEFFKDVATRRNDYILFGSSYKDEEFGQIAVPSPSWYSQDEKFYKGQGSSERFLVNEWTSDDRIVLIKK